jgi:predicted nucleic acid-binding protein
MAAEYRPAHRGIDAVDYVLAATASVFDAELLTTNVGALRDVPGAFASVHGLNLEMEPARDTSLCGRQAVLDA